MREFLTGTKDPLFSQGGLCSVELDMEVQYTGNTVAKVGAITLLFSEQNRQSTALLVKLFYYLLVSDYPT